MTNMTTGTDTTKVDEMVLKGETIRHGDLVHITAEGNGPAHDAVFLHARVAPDGHVVLVEVYSRVKPCGFHTYRARRVALI